MFSTWSQKKKDSTRLREHDRLFFRISRSRRDFEVYCRVTRCAGSYNDLDGLRAALERLKPVLAEVLVTVDKTFSSVSLAPQTFCRDPANQIDRGCIQVQGPSLTVRQTDRVCYGVAQDDPVEEKRRFQVFTHEQIADLIIAAFPDLYVRVEWTFCGHFSRYSPKAERVESSWRAAG